MSNTIIKSNFNFPGQKSVYKGKVREVYNINDDKLVMIATDRLSAFDVVMPKGIPYKGQILNQIATSMMKATEDLVPNWLTATPDPNVAVGHLCEPFKVEMVIRGYLSGHAAREYKAGKRTLCGVAMPEGMKENDKFPEPLITPATKAEMGDHDEDISREDILKRGIVSEADYTILEDYTRKLFARGTEIAAKRGLILVDTKYEFGKTKDGKIVLIDEIHTPDSSRYFYADGKRVFFSFFFWGIISSAMVILDYQLTPEDYVWNFDLQKFLVLAVIGIVLLPFQTSFEEYLFRGYLMQGIGVMSLNKKFPLYFIIFTVSIILYFVLDNTISFRWYFKILYLLITLFLIIYSNSNQSYLESKKYKLIHEKIARRWLPLVITSVIFGVMHIANPEVEKLGYVIMVYYIGTGFFLGIITLMDEGMELALGFHAANNLFTALLVTADWTALQTDSILKDISEPGEMALGEIFVPVFIVFPILLFIFSKMYKWNNWNDRLFG